MSATPTPSRDEALAAAISFYRGLGYDEPDATRLAGDCVRAMERIADTLVEDARRKPGDDSRAEQ